MLGISMSSVTTCGLSCGIRARATLLSGAEPTTSISGSSPRAWLTRRRITTESSTTRARSLLPGGICLLAVSTADLSTQQAEHAELVFDGFVGEWFDDVLVRPGFKRGHHLVGLGFRG